jgi:dihydroorotase-like cyclic amidohydrolase
MEVGRTVIASRHVVLPDQVVPVTAFVTIEGEVIADIVVIPEEADYNAALQFLDSDVNLVNCENDYVSPGLIDLNFKFNGEWEGYGHGTMAALAGGTTLVVETPSLFDMEADESEPLFCDVGALALIDGNDINDIPTIA